MNLWFLCCVLVFIASQGYGWLNQQSWFVESDLALPWIMLGGLGLAIASNYQRQSTASTSHDSNPHKWIHSPSLRIPTLQQVDLAGKTADAQKSAITPPSPIKQDASKPHSISFEIAKRTPKSNA
jgi:hypothetical protein